MARILIADDAVFMRMTIKKMLEPQGHEIVAEAGDGEETIKLCTETQPDLIILDITMPGMDGIEALEKIKKMDRNVKIIICSALGQQELVAQALVLGAENFIVKPFEAGQLIAAVEKVMRS